MTKKSNSLDSMFKKYIDHQIIDDCNKRFNPNDTNNSNIIFIITISILVLLVILSYLLF